MAFADFIRREMHREMKDMEVKPLDEKPGGREPIVRLGFDTPPPAEVRIAPPPRGGSGPREVTPREDLPVVQSALSPLADEEVWGTEEKAVKAPPWGWLALLALTGAGVIGWGIAATGKGERRSASVRDQAVLTKAAEGREEARAGLLIETLETAAERFLGASSVEELRAVVRHPDRVSPLMADHYRNVPPVPARLKEIRTLQPTTLELNGDFWVMAAEVQGGEIRHLLLEVIAENEVRVDWETAVVYQPMEWDRFARERPAGLSMEFRVHALAEDFHSHEFVDPKKWRCYRLTAPGGEATLFGYARAGSAAAKELAVLFRSRKGKEQPLTLRLLVPEGINSPAGVVIEAVVSRRWILVESP